MNSHRGWFTHGGLSVVFLGCAGLAALWLVFAATMRYKK